MTDRTTFCQNVTQLCGDDFKRCSQCVNCSAQCPFAEVMNHGPNGLIRLIQYNLAQEVLESPDIWPCIHCRRCAISCPMAIDIPVLMSALREMALEAGVRVDETAIARCHRIAAGISSAKPAGG